MSKYLTATEDDRNFLNKTVPNLPLPNSCDALSTSSNKEGSIFNIPLDILGTVSLLVATFCRQPFNTSLAFFILSFSFSDAHHISKYFALIADSTLNFLIRDSFSFLRS